MKLTGEYKKLTELILLGPPLIPHGLPGIEQEALHSEAGN
jgi:hypothetical protein